MKGICCWDYIRAVTWMVKILLCIICCKEVGPGGTEEDWRRND